MLWLTTHNRLYFDIPLDSNIMDTYPDDELLPGLEHHIFENHTLESSEIFAKETTSFFKNPAQLMNDGTSDTPLLMMMVIFPFMENTIS